MDDSKIFMFPDGGTRQTSNDVNSLLPLLMCNGGFGGCNWIWIIFLFFLYPLMRNGGMKMEIQELEECLDKYEERDNRYDDDPQYRSRNPYDDEERYHEREEYGHRERGRYGRY